MDGWMDGISPTLFSSSFSSSFLLTICLAKGQSLTRGRFEIAAYSRERRGGGKDRRIITRDDDPNSMHGIRELNELRKSNARKRERERVWKPRVSR